MLIVLPPVGAPAPDFTPENRIRADAVIERLADRGCPSCGLKPRYPPARADANCGWISQWVHFGCGAAVQLQQYARPAGKLYVEAKYGCRTPTQTALEAMTADILPARRP